MNYREKAIKEGANYECKSTGLLYRRAKGNFHWEYKSKSSGGWFGGLMKHEDYLADLEKIDESEINKVTSKAKSCRVLKYPIPILEDFTVKLPADIHVLRVDNQDGHLYIWGATSGGETKDFHFKASKTGGDMGDLTGYRYVGFASVYIQMELGLYYFIKED